MKKLLTILAVISVLSIPALSMAQMQAAPEPIQDFQTVGGVLNVFNRVINWIFTFLMIAAVVFILVAAFKYLTAGGDATKVQTANKMLLYAAIAIAVAVLSRSIPVLVQSFVRSGAGS